MSSRATLTLFARIGMAALCAAVAGPSAAHHDAASAYRQTEAVEHLMELADRTCFGHGDDVEGLKAEADARGWQEASESELARGESRVSKLIAGWVFTNQFGSFAVMHSKFKEGPSEYLCSITTKLSFDRHDQIKSSFEQRFATTLKQEFDRSGKHTDRFLLASPRKSTIDSSLVYIPSKGALTIHMFHGRNAGPAAALPPARRAKAAALPTSSPDHINHLIELAYRSCFSLGADPDGLRAEALRRGWRAVQETELGRYETERLRMIAGWTFNDAFGGGAVIHSVSKDKPPIYRCSIPAQLASAQHDRITATFERRFATRVSEGIDGPDQHIDRLTVDGPRRAIVYATLLYAPSKRALTIWLEHGRGPSKEA